MIPLGLSQIEGNEWKYVKECLDTNWLCEGRFIKLFEDSIAEYIGVKHAIACSNGTSALHIALILAGVQPEDEVIVPTITFIAPVNAVRYANAHPVFMDCDDYYNLDVKKLKKFLETECEIIKSNTVNRKTRRTIRAIIPVHIFGNSVNMDEINKLAEKYNLKVIEDAAESIGSEYKGIKTGNLSHIGCLSFNFNKTITTAGGGMILTNNPDYSERARKLIAQAKEPGINYIHNEIGYNYRLNNIQSAIGVAQFENLSKYLEAKKNNFEVYKNKLKDIKSVKLLDAPEYAKPNYWFYTLQVESEEIRNKLINEMTKEKIQVRPIWLPNHLQKHFKNFQNYNIEKAVELWETSINIPCSVGITKQEIQKVCDVIIKTV